ncbi:cysteine proteinase [Hyaloscypha bicolor E]|uniref:ubiquitinyl hydrolase 1 n=1 Tax=Hyaloscypha bicolor E TaxID=1095630 RepID=A0A2J6T3M5_9HELO|nr:cysteine proteinase [Hyaloscypha bicolor E]PMD57607.1 cysteine proteinase [Hyaloscypha bicolor E]
MLNGKQGPLVGEKKSSRAITEEYAKADPVYVAKTAALPQKFSHYRPILGDGNCGWRAAGFSYFETLLRLQNRAQLEEELARMTSLNNLLTTVGGFEEWLFEDMVAETTNLLRDLADLVPSSPRAAEELLRQRFNNREISDSIVYHLRLLASSWLKGNRTSYQDFIPDGLGVDGYTKDWIEPVNQEIDHLGMTLLIDILLKPIGFAVEIVYLDRSEGSQANSHIFRQEDSNGAPINPGCPMIHLLYRPSHYDILYKEPAAIQVMDEVARNPHVNRAFTRQISVHETPAMMGGFPQQLDMATLLCIPGFGLSSPPQHQPFHTPQYSQQPIDHTYNSSPISASISPISPGGSSTTSSSALPGSFPAQPPSQPSLASPTLATPHSSFPAPTTQIPIHTNFPPHTRPALASNPSLSSHLSHPSELSSPSSATSSFRPSKYEWEAAADWQEPVVFQTSTFKNSHYNTAHYNNPNFQPEEWTPESEEPPAPRKRSS